MCGRLNIIQKKLSERYCRDCGVKYIVCRQVEDIDEIIPKSHSSKYKHIDDFYRKNPEMRDEKGEKK